MRLDLVAMATRSLTWEEEASRILPMTPETLQTLSNKHSDSCVFKAAFFHSTSESRYYQGGLATTSIYVVSVVNCCEVVRQICWEGSIYNLMNVVEF